MTSRQHDISNLIFGFLIVLALSLMSMGGLALFGNTQSSQAIPLGGRDPKLPMDTLAQQSIGPNSGKISYETPIPWSEFVPKINGELSARALERFGKVAIGPSNATITLIEYGAYGCTSCRKVHEKEIVEKLLATYPDDIRYVFVAWPVLHANDKLAAEAVLCALDQGSQVFWDYHNALLTMTNDQFNRYDNYSRYTTLAEHIENIDVGTFDTCVIDGTHREFVFDLTDAGFEMNLRGTPTFFVNGEVVAVYDLESKVMEILKHQ
jgi:protein-disulfide isomerase